MDKIYKVCLIGCGRMGATIDDEVKDRPHSQRWMPYSHAAGYVAVERTEMVAVSDVMENKVEAIQKRYDVPAGYTDYKEMIEKEKPEIVSIATRPGPHAEMVAFCAENGVKGIYCEKPLCCSMKEADIIVESCEKYNVKFNYGTQRRYVELYHTVRKLIEADEIGNALCVIAKCGSGAAQWSHTHTADMVMQLAGDPEVSYVQGTVNAKEKDWDGDYLYADPGIICGHVGFANGVEGYIVAGGAYEFEVIGSKGRIHTLNNGLGARLWKAQGQWNIKEEAPFPDVKIESGTVKCIENLVEAIDNDNETMGNVHLARRSQEIILGIVASHKYGGKRLLLPMENRNIYVGKKDW
ncbi:hypothetical protein GF312_10995 [Candidatus Poribacteria bacterium]|nr:hypothetical protein [Candidatus Poribacteria bacterium]